MFHRTYRQTEPPVALTAATALASMLQRRIKVLFVDDETYFRDIMVAAATGFVMDMVAVPSCAAAREQMRKSEFDAVILDYRLTNGTGVELYAEIARRRPRWQVVFLTGYGDDAMRKRVYEIGPARIYEKATFCRPDFIEQLFLQLGARRR